MSGERVRVRMSRYSRGMTPIRPSRPVYGWHIVCNCGGLDVRVNGTKREAGQDARAHLRTVHGLRGEDAYDALDGWGW